MSNTKGLRVTVSAKLTDDEAAIIEKIRGGIPRSEWIRATLLEACGIPLCRHPGCGAVFERKRDGSPGRYCPSHRGSKWTKERQRLQRQEGAGHP